jgi:hypothetical protein
MLVLNNKMLSLLLKHKVDRRLNVKFKRILNKGFIKANGCHFLKELFDQQTFVTKTDFNDKTQYECFINSINIDDYTKSHPLSQALLLMIETEKRWSAYNKSASITIILSKTDYGYNFKFHLKRSEAEWINPNEIELFKEPILVFKS